MMAWTVSDLGAPQEALVMGEREKPTPSRTQVLVRVRAAAVGYPDLMLSAGTYQLKPALPFVPGLEVAGEVVDCGAEVSGIALGDRVCGLVALPHGAFAEYAVLEAATTFPAPPRLSNAEASALTLAYQTAWFGLHHRAQLREGETLLVHAAAGGVGSAAVQLGALAGARVIASVGSQEKADVPRQLGAADIIGGRDADIAARVLALTDGRGADCVFDPVGGDAYRRSTKCIAFEGRIVIVGFASGDIPAPSLGHALVKNYSILGLHWGLYASTRPDETRRVHAALIDLAEAGRVTPLVSEIVSFEQVPEAIGRVASGRTTGRIVVGVQP